MIACLTFALCVFGRHADGWSRTAKTVRRFFFLTMMLLSLLSEEVYFPCVLFVTKPCFEWSYQQDQRLWMFMESCFTIFILCQACQQERCRKDRQAWIKVLISLHCVRTFVAEQGQWKPHEIHMKTLWKLVQESKVVWWFLMWCAFNWSPSVSFVLLFDLCWATNLQVSILSLSKDFQAWFSSVHGQQIMNLSEIESC